MKTPWGRPFGCGLDQVTEIRATQWINPKPKAIVTPVATQLSRRKVGLIGELGMEIPYYDFEDGEIRLFLADLVTKLIGAPVQFPDCILGIRKDLDSAPIDL
jgi:hypothetical protein